MQTEEYIITDGKRSVGRLSLRREGLYTLIEAWAEASDAVTRLYLCGGGKCVCLGVMLPENGKVTLRRRLSKLELSALPRPIEAARTCPPEAIPAGGPPQASEPEWKPMPDGSLLRSTPDGRYVALPAKLRRNVPGIRLAMINGKEYLIFRY